MLMKRKKLNSGRDNSSFDVGRPCARSCSICAVNYSLIGSTNTVTPPPQCSAHQEHSNVARSGLEKLSHFFSVQSRLSRNRLLAGSAQIGLRDSAVRHAQGFSRQSPQKSSFKIHITHTTLLRLSLLMLLRASCQVLEIRILATSLHSPKLQSSRDLEPRCTETDHFKWLLPLWPTGSSIHC